MAEEKAYCGSEGQHSQRLLEELILNTASRTDLPMGDGGTREEEKRGQDKMNYKGKKSSGEGKEAQGLERFRGGSEKCREELELL